MMLGDEPLLARVERLREIMEAVREPQSALPKPLRLDPCIHTDEGRLDGRFRALFLEDDV